MSGESKAIQFVTLQAEMRKYMTDLREKDPKLYSTGLPCLDKVLAGGYAPGEVVVIAASTSQGKTMVGMQLAWAISEVGDNVLIVSEEMTSRALAERSIECASEVKQEEWRNEWEPVFDEVIDWEERHPGKILLPAVPCHTVTRMQDTVDQAVAHFGVKAVVVDYVQLLHAPGNSRYEQVTNVSIAIKQIASEHSVSVIALAQFNKAAEGEDMPAMHHIADSSQIPKDADVVLLCKWPGFVDKTFKDPYEYWIKCAKNRNRGIREGGAVSVRFEPMRQRLIDPKYVPVEEHSNYRPEFADFNQGAF
jgi:replicative DNA helicase